MENHKVAESRKGLWIMATGLIIPLIILLCIAAFVLLRAAGNLNIDRISGDVYITEAHLTAAPEGSSSGNGSSGPPFHPHTEEIHLITTVQSDAPVPVGVRWYREGDLIFEERARVMGTVAWYVRPGTLNYFQPGHYKVEIFLVEEPVRTLEFEIIDDSDS